MNEPLDLQPEKNKRLPFEELTLWQVLWLFTYHPGATLRRFFEEIALPLEDDDPKPAPEEIALPFFIEENAGQIGLDSETEYPIVEDAPSTIEVTDTAPRQAGMLTAGMTMTLILALIGANRLWEAATNPAFYATNNTNGAFFWFFLAALTYIFMAVTISLPWWRERLTQKPTPPVPDETANPSLALPLQGQGTEGWSKDFFAFVERHSARLALMPIAWVLAYLAFARNVIVDPDTERIIGVQITTGGGLAWLLAIIAWFCILGVDLNRGLRQFYQRMSAGIRVERPRLTWRPGWQHLVLLVILLVAAYLRLHRLEDVPPEMTSDHIEKLLDAVKVSEGLRPVFLANNGGREAFQMYFIAGLVRLFSMDFSFNAIKLATVIEGMITVALGYWFGVLMIGRREREIGIWTGLALAALMAVSSWHIMLSRLGLRIVLTPLTTMLVTIFLVRGMRHNRRLDFVIAGFWLGAGIYFYQANRMLPLLVIAGTVLAAAINSRNRLEVWKYAVNLGCAALMALVVFLPMFRYQQTYPADYWNRTRGRIYGEDAFFRTNPDTGRQEAYQPGIREQIERFDFGKFDDSYWTALKMWSWKGDGLWISNGQGRPAFDPYTNALFMIGIVAWLVLIFRKWDVGYLLVPVGIIIMLLPTAMTLAYPGENPSFTRASGTLPFVFLLAAYPLAQFTYYLRHLNRRGLGHALALGVSAPLILLAAQSNYNSYFNIYREGYANSWKPYSEFAAPMQAFAQGEGSYGNAFMIAYPHWLDHRILGTVAGDIKWNNGLVNREDVYGFLLANQHTPYEYDPTKPLFFMYHGSDAETRTWLQQRFPGGIEYAAPVASRPELTFYYYIAPPGFDWLNALVQEETIEQGCVVGC